MNRLHIIIYRHIAATLLMAAAIFGLQSCSEEVNAPSLAGVNFNLEYPDGMQGAALENVQLSCRNVATGTSATYDALQGLQLVPGLYDLSLEADLSLASDSLVHVRAYKPSVTVGGAANAVSLSLYESLDNDDFIISEIFFTGTLQPTGTSYRGDSYFKIYNNTDHVLYADGLALFESKFQTTQKYDYTPNIMPEAMTADAIYVVPGSGKDHPVDPGKSLLICDAAIDHRASNPLSFDLSKADFEWYDASSNASVQDIDNPAVDNLDKWYCYTNTVWIPHNRGFRAYGIARIPVGKDEYLNNYAYDYDYTMVLPAGTFPMSGHEYRMPNQWVKDVVNLSVESKYAWNVCAPALDQGWTHCGSIDQDKTRFFKSVRRKMLYLGPNGKPLLKDTNNSTEDFNPDCVASEIELQGTAVNVDGTTADHVTYDGVTPEKGL